MSFAAFIFRGIDFTINRFRETKVLKNIRKSINREAQKGQRDLSAFRQSTM
jgi:hypothetical protein